ncbi:MAG TPA: hypothetical protein VFK33_04020 [Bacillales bacterium]|nr:hypothetical protein [Bacillales bacterium]
MKKLVLFLISFAFLFVLLQILSGWILTMAYTPDVPKVWKESADLPQQIVFVGGSFTPTFLIAVLSAGLAFGIQKVYAKKHK